MSIYECSLHFWQLFKKYHYLNSSLHRASKCYLAKIDKNVVGFIAIIHFPHPHIKNMKRVHRLVVLPDYQGVGIGKKLLEGVGEVYLKNNYRFVITTSNSSLLFHFYKSDVWKFKRKGIVRPHGGRIFKNADINKRFTFSFEMIKKKI